jgi:hypothetical protein
MSMTTFIRRYLRVQFFFIPSPNQIQIQIATCFKIVNKIGLLGCVIFNTTLMIIQVSVSRERISQFYLLNFSQLFHFNY